MAKPGRPGQFGFRPRKWDDRATTVVVVKRERHTGRRETGNNKDRCSLAADRFKSVTVLVADDDDDDRTLTADAFRETRLVNRLHFVTDGEDLMDYLHRRGKFAPPAAAPLPNLILLDLNMPRKDGREALREIKADPRLRSIVVIVLTTSEAQEDIQRIYDLGACSYISKPVTFERLVDVLKAVVEYWFDLVQLPVRDDATP